MTAVHECLGIAVGGVALEADGVVPAELRGVVLFAHGSSSGRRSPRNQYVAHELQAAGFATVLADLLSVEEERIDARTAGLRFRNRPPGGAGRGADRPVGRLSAHHRPACRLVRGQHGRSSRRGSASPLRHGNRSSRGSSRPGRFVAFSCSPTHTSDRRRTQPVVAELNQAAMGTTSPGRSVSRSCRGVAPVRGTGSVGAGGAPGQRLVRPVSDPPGIPKPGPGSPRLMGG